MRKTHIAALILFFLTYSLTNQIFALEKEPEIIFSNLSANNGLSQNTVLSIGQDKIGNLWFSSFDGLNRYDGYDFTVFRHNPQDSTTIGGNTIRNVFFDSLDRIWVGTTSGLSFYDSRKDRFHNFNTPEGFVTGIAEIDETRLMVGTENRLRIFDTTTWKFTDKGLTENMSELKVSTLKRHGENIFIGTYGDGLFVYSLSRNDFRRISAFPAREKINVILFGEDGRMWAGTEGDGLYLFDTQTFEYQNFRHVIGKKGQICSNYVRSLEYDSDGRLWIGTFGGLDIYDSGTFTNYTGSLSQKSVRSIFRDSQNGMWLGTYFGGVDYWAPLRNRCKNIRKSHDANGLNDNIISCITEDSDGILWIGTNTGGVNRYDPSNGRFSHYPLPGNVRPADIESNDIKAIFIDGDSPFVYIGAHAGGLNILDKRSGQISNYGFGEDKTLPQDVYCIRKSGPGRLWIGSLQGLYSFDTVRRTFEKVTGDTDGNPIRPQMVQVIFEDSGKNLWIGGEDGLQVFRISGKGLAGGGSIPALSRISSVQSVMESSTGTVWIGTRDGLYGYDSESGRVRQYTMDDGLPNNIIHGIEEDSGGSLWISTDFGISRFNPFSDRFRNYNVTDGLQGNQFTTYSHCRTQKGYMYFGGTNGITVFSPEDMEDNPYTPQPVLTELLVYNRPVRPDDGSGIMDESISSAKEITLAHDQNYFTLRFSVPNYLSGAHNSFSYRLEGFDKEWYTVTDRRSVSYSNLPHGKYRFLLKAANNDGKWNEDPVSLVIRVRPQWYQSILAIILFILTGLGAAYLAIRFIMERKMLENKLLLEQQESEHQEELSQMKMRFFINISHELRTPLTLIINPLHEMISKASDLWMRKQLKYIERNTQRLLHLVNQLMDYRRAELGVFKLRVQQEDIHKIVLETWSFYENLAKNKKLKYRLLSGIEDRKMYVDGNYLELILNNLLSNAFKYTDSGSITVTLAEKDKAVVLTVADTGIGIPEVAKEKVFERFYQIESRHIGSGIGLSLVQRLVELHHGTITLDSEEGKGSTFTVTFPQDLNVYSAEELENAEENPMATNSLKYYMLDTESVQEEQTPDSSTIKRGRLLVAEENEEVRTYMYNELSKTFDVTVVSDGHEALEVLKTIQPDIVLADLTSPDMDGLKLCTAIKQDIGINHIPVLIFSSKADSKDYLDAFKAGADDYIAKPFSMSILIAKIQNSMRTRFRQQDKVSKTLDISPEKVTFNAADEDFLKRAVAVVEKNMDNEAFSTDNFAKEMNMSRSNLHLKLKAITGESALDFVHKVRFREACRLLQEGVLTVSEISDKVGFSTPSYFATCFKKYMGCIPSEYINKK